MSIGNKKKASLADSVTGDAFGKCSAFWTSPDSQAGQAKSGRLLGGRRTELQLRTSHKHISGNLVITNKRFMQGLYGFLEALQAILRSGGDVCRYLSGVEQTAQHVAMLFAEIRIEQGFVECADHGSKPARCRSTQGQQQFVGRDVHRIPYYRFGYKRFDAWSMPN